MGNKVEVVAHFNDKSLLKLCLGLDIDLYWVCEGISCHKGHKFTLSGATVTHDLHA